MASAAIRAGFPWAAFAAAAATSPWLFTSWWWALRAGPIVFVAVWVAASLTVFVFPIARLGAWAARRVTARDGPRRLANVGAELALAIGVPTERVAVVDADAPNVGVFPTDTGNIVIATAAAVDTLDRRELEALVASQLTVASDRRVRIASSAQLVQSPRFALLFAAPFLNPFFMPTAFLAFFGGRSADATRDLVADDVAVRTTFNPAPLARALRHLGEHAGEGSRLRVGLPGFLVDQFWVMSTRSTMTTTVTTGGSSREWTTADEIAAEMRVRADRVERAARGDWSGFGSLRAWRAAVRSLGRRADAS